MISIYISIVFMNSVLKLLIGQNGGERADEPRDKN